MNDLRSIFDLWTRLSRWHSHSLFAHFCGWQAKQAKQAKQAEASLCLFMIRYHDPFIRMQGYTVCLSGEQQQRGGGGVRIIFGSIAACVRTYVYTYINLAYTITQYYYLYLFKNIMSYNLHIHLNILIHNYQYLRLYLTKVLQLDYILKSTWTSY